MTEEKTSAEKTPKVKKDTPQPVKEKKEKRWLKPLLLSIFGIVLVGALVFTGYILGQKGIRLELVEKSVPGATPTLEPTPVSEITPSPTPLPTDFPAETPVEAEPTADWETYTNSKYGYQFKHLSGWGFKTSVIGEATQPLYVIRESVDSKNIDDYVVSIKVWDNPGERSLIDWLQFMIDSKALGLPAEDVELISNYTVGGEPAFRIWSDPLSKGKEPGRCVQVCPALSVYFTHDDKAYRAEHVYMREVDEASQKIFNLSLSTFQFLD